MTVVVIILFTGCLLHARIRALAIRRFTPAGIVLRFRYTKKWINDKPGLPKGWYILNVYTEQVNGLKYPQIQGNMIVLLIG